MSSQTAVDYVAAYFPFETLPKIKGKLTYDSMKQLKKMIKANASSVVSNLGDDSHSHLGLVIPKSEYTKITGTIYKTPQHPGELKINENTELHNEFLRELYNERLHLFLETLAIESILQSQITASIDPMYLKELKNTAYTIPYILA